MSGLAGLLRRDGRPVNCGDLDRMAACLARRGPDGGGTSSEGAVGLVHRLLWTTPESLHEKLPLFDATGDLVVTADARIDNRDELIRALGLTGRPPEELTDSNLILGAWARWGERCPEHLLGDFAFAVWDRQARTLFCARDHLGVKPLYYHLSPSLFAFASEIRALLALPEVQRRIDESRVAAYLGGLTHDRTATFYQDVRRLPAGHALLASGDGVRVRAYWTLDPSREIRLGSDEAYAEAFQERITEAVRCRLRSAFPVGAMLSGGLDSSSVVCVARRLLIQAGGGRLHTFSAIFPDVPACDERPFIEAVVAQGGLDPHYIRGDRLNPLAILKRELSPGDEAFQNPGWYMHWALFDEAGRHGVRVLLTGTGGDSAVSHGFARLTELAGAWRWRTLAEEIRGTATAFGVSPWQLASRAIRPLLPRPLQRTWRRATGSRRLLWDPVVSRELARRTGLVARAEASRRDHLDRARQADSDHQQQVTSARTGEALEALDWASGARGIELRDPFFDRRLVELCVALPSDQKLRGGRTRVVMRRALAGVLPDEIRTRGGKANLTTMLPSALAALGDEGLERLILSDGDAISSYVDDKVLKDAYQRYVVRQTPRDAATLWRVATLAVWLRHAAPAVDGQPAVT